jgi:hypothetical protein
VVRFYNKRGTADQCKQAVKLMKDRGPELASNLAGEGHFIYKASWKRRSKTEIPL